jgi:flavorubredoxin
MDKPFNVTGDIAVLPTHLPIPEMGLLPINAFVIKAREPVLVDTGLTIESGGFMKALESVIDPLDLKWVWLTHDDADHTGSLEAVLKAAPKARLATHPLMALRLATVWPLPMDRVYFLNPGDSIDAGDRTLTAVRPPVFDNPGSIGIHDDKTGAFFSVDSFGAIMPSPAQYAADHPEADLAQGMTVWATADSVWVHLVDQRKFQQALDNVRKMEPSLILSAHLAPARDKTEQLLKALAAAPTAPPFVGPSQANLERLLEQMKQGNLPVPARS